MRLRIAHEIVTRFDPPASGAIRTLRMTPRTYDGQYVGSWRIDVDQDCRLDRVADPYGNVVHSFSVGGPLAGLSVLATGEVEVDDTAGILQAGAAEKLPAILYLRPSRLTEADAAIRDLAATVRSAAAGALDRCHILKTTLFGALAAEAMATDELTGAASRRAGGVMEAGRASPGEAAHVFIAAAQVLDIPARYVSGYLWRGDRRDAGEAAHAWAEAHIAGLGWVGFDPLNDRCPTDAYVRIATGLDQNGAAFLRGAEQGTGAAREIAVRAMITQAEF